MEKLIFAQGNNRELSFMDKIFGIAGKAAVMIEKEGKDKVIDATIGALLDDEGKFVVFESVWEGLHKLSPADFANYAPISGLPAYLDIVQKYAFGNHRPNMYTAAVATPGGSGAIRNTFVNYSKTGDTILTCDWYWAAYHTLATENYRKLDTYKLLTEDGKYNVESLKEKCDAYLAVQDSLLLIINTPAHNPTGFSLTDEDWSKVIDLVNGYGEKGKRITIFIDAAYIDYTDNPDASRVFFKLFEKAHDNVLAVIGYSASKGFTLYGMRVGAMICMTNREDICVEFANVANFSCRGTWSNGTRAAQQLLVNMYNDEELKAKVDQEREENKNMLLKRGKAFEAAAQECGLEIVPYDSGFFASIPCKNPDEVGELLHKEGIFLVPLAAGLRVALSAVNEAQCRKIAPAVKKAMDEYYGK